MMDTTLVTVTLLSMGMAAALSVIVWRMLRDERQRSEARVHALVGMARPAARTAPPDLDIPLRSSAAAVAPMFAPRDTASPWATRAAVMTGLALLLASGLLLTLTLSDSGGARRPALGAQAAGTSVPAGRAAPAIGLELLSLRDTRQPGALTITGLVQNPRDGTALTRVTVTAYAFDEKGSFLASGRALIDITALAPGDESPFVVSVPVTDTVARYRIGFRGEDGRVIAHIDKRQQAPVAVLRPGSGQALRDRSGRVNW